MFSKRFIEPELLDHADAEEARHNLADLVRINSYFGGHSTIRKLLQGVVSENEEFSLLDVGAASGDTARLVSRLYPRARVTSLDYNAVNLAAAPNPKVLANAFDLPFAPGSFDLVMSSLFLHHFDNFQVTALLRDFYRISRRGILIADLERHILPYLFLRTSKPFFGWGHITVHDGLRSVRAAFRAKELAEVARDAGIRDPQIQTHRPAFRLTLRGIKA